MRQYYLTDFKVLDLTRVLAGPLCTMALGDLGADVIKIERPGGGDDTRGWGPPFDAHGQSAYFLSVNRNKWSVAADLDRADDRDLIHRLADGADVVVENFRPGTLERRGLGAAEMLARRQGLVWCTITGFGTSSKRLGYDFIVQAEQGWMAITGPPHGPPSKIGVALADVVAGKDAAIAVLAALVRRDRMPPDAPWDHAPRDQAPGAQTQGDAIAGHSRHITISLAHSATAALVNVAQNALVTGADAPRWGNAHPNLVPYQLFDAADRPIALGVGTDAQWRACALALGLPDLINDSALATNAGRVTNRDRVVDALSNRFRQRTAGDWVSHLNRVGVPAGLVRSVLETLRDADASPATGVAPSIPGAIRYPPPRLDEHGAIVREHGWDAFARGRR